jgi:hypothetical protein
VSTAKALRAAIGSGRGCSQRSSFLGALRLQGTYEWLRGRPKKARTWWEKSRATAAKLGAHYEGALTELEVGRRLGDQAILVKAAAEFEAMGAEYDSESALSLVQQVGAATTRVV